MIKPMQQARSRETLERLLDASEALLARRAFDEISLGEIAHRAGVTSGAIYARMPDKDALLLALEARLRETIAPDAAAILDVGAWTARSLHNSLVELFRATIAAYRRHAAVIRALSVRARTFPVLRARLERENAARIEAVTACVLAAPGKRHRATTHAVEFALLLTTGALREAILFNDFWPSGVRMSDERLAGELARAFAGYLASGGTTRARAAR